MIMKFKLISLRKKILKCNVKDYQYTEISVIGFSRNLK